MKSKANRLSKLFILMLLAAASVVFSAASVQKWDVLSESERQIFQRVLDHWESWVPAKKADGTAPLINFEELYAGLGAEETAFLNRVRSIDPQKDFGFRGGPLDTDSQGVRFARLENQKIEREGKPAQLDPQYLPAEVYEAYEKMMSAMKKDLGRRLWVESGYRSPAYQLYTFLFYLPEHHYSLVETGQWVALPGYSEHGAPAVQAIDFINEKGINGDDPGQSVEDFENLPEYDWLGRRAREFGFELSYPRGKPGITFEPWHWRYHPTHKNEAGVH